MVNGVNVVDGSLVRPPYYPSLVPSSGYAYKPVVYPYDPSKTIPATNSVQSAASTNQSLGVKRDEVPPVYYPYGYTVPVDKAQPYEVLPVCDLPNLHLLELRLLRRLPEPLRVPRRPCSRLRPLPWTDLRSYSSPRWHRCHPDGSCPAPTWPPLRPRSLSCLSAGLRC